MQKLLAQSPANYDGFGTGVWDEAGIAHLPEGQAVSMRVVETPKGREAVSIAMPTFAARDATRAMPGYSTIPAPAKTCARRSI